MFQTRSRARIRGRIARVLTSLTLAGGLGLPAGPVAAIEVTPGMSAPLSGTTSAANPDLAGGVVSDGLRPFEIRDAGGVVLLRGNLQDRVTRSASTGQLIFAPRLRELEAPGGDAWVLDLSVSGYSGVSTDVEYRTDGSGSVGPRIATRTPGAGDRLAFEHQPGKLMPPEQGHFLSIFTDARHHAPRGSVTLTAQQSSGGPVFSTLLQGTQAPDRDSDGDDVPDSVDVCPTQADPQQADRDGNGVGDACECGDQNGDGNVDVSDIVAINQAIFDPKLATSLCDANGDGLCNVQDIVAVNRRIFGGEARCAARPGAGTPGFAVDPSLEPTLGKIAISDLSGDHPISSVADDLGHQIDFVEDEVIVALHDPAELPAVQARLNATVLRTVDPSKAGAPPGLPVFYLLKVSPRTASPTELVELILASGAENGAQHRVSSQSGLDLLTAIGRETHDAGTQLGANFLVRYDGLSERTTREAPMSVDGPAGYSPDAFHWPYMSMGSVQDIGAAEAARLVRDSGRTPAPASRVDFMILDGGFSSTADYPTPLLPGASRLDVRNPNACSGGASCPWHGTAVASTALSTFDDGRGAAGPASQVARPIFVQSPNPNFWDYLEYIFGTLPSALGRFPEIVNISASADIPAGLCLVGVCTAVDMIGSSVHAAGMLVFASAGNDGANVDDEDCFIGCWESFYRVPCEAPGVVCVGGLLHNSTAKHPSSAFGSDQRRSSGSVDIYGPFSTWVHDDPDGGSTNAKFVNGTSFASPFAASIGALIKAANPSLSAAGIWNVMRDHAHTLSAGNVHRWLDAYEAVRAALGGNAPPFAQIRSPLEGQRFSWNASNPPLVCDVDDDGVTGLGVSWTSDRDGSIGAASANTSAGRLSLGTHRITCTASDGRFPVSDSVSIRIENDAPSVVIDNPAGGSRFFFSQSIPVAATPSDVNGNFSSLRWEALRGTTLVWSGAGTAPTIPARTLSPATYTLRAIATDSLGLTGSAQITLVVATDPVDLPPSISSPTITPLPGVGPFDAPPSYFWVDDCPVDVNGSAPGNGYCQRLRFNATVSDDHDPVASLSYTFEVRRGGALVSTATPSSAQATLDLVAGSYQVRLIVRDSAGNSSSFTWTFTVDELI